MSESLDFLVVFVLPNFCREGRTLCRYLPGFSFSLSLLLPALFVLFILDWCGAVTFEVREEAVGIGQSDSTAKYGIGESVGQSGDVMEDEYGISVIPERFTDIVTGVDPSKFAGGSGRIGEDVSRNGFGYGVDSTGGSSRGGVGRPGGSTGPGGQPGVSEWVCCVILSHAW